MKTIFEVSCYSGINGNLQEKFDIKTEEAAIRKGEQMARKYPYVEILKVRYEGQEEDWRDYEDFEFVKEWMKKEE